MKVRIENKVFEVDKMDGEFKTGYPRKSFTLKNTKDESDILFLKKWAESVYDVKTGIVGYAKDYKKEVDFYSDEFQGYMRGCFIVTPSDRIPEQRVEVVFDYIKIL